MCLWASIFGMWVGDVMKKFVILFCVLAMFTSVSCQKEEDKTEVKNDVQVEPTDSKTLNIAVFLPGV